LSKKVIGILISLIFTFVSITVTLLKVFPIFIAMDSENQKSSDFFEEVGSEDFDRHNNKDIIAALKKR
jgi:hypothetical protein